jgi:hypothetical protein
MKTWWPFIVVLLVSAFPWILVPGLNHAQDLEGELMVGFFLGTLSFVLTPPLSVIALSELNQTKKLGFWKFFGFFILLCSPILTFESISTTMTIVPMIVPAINEAFRTVSQLPQIRAYSAVAAVSIYAMYALILYPIAKRGVRPTLMVAIPILIISAAVIFVLIARS